MNRKRDRRMPLAGTLLALALVSPLSLSAAPQALADQRISLGMTSAERVQFLSEMRQMLASLQRILAGVATEDRAGIAAAARYSGNRMARATPDTLRRRLPQAFRDLGGPTHMLFEELAIRAETDDMESLTSLTAELMKNCLACHAAFRAN